MVTGSVGEHVHCYSISPISGRVVVQQCKHYLSMAIVSLWGNMCTMRALSVSREVSSWVRWTRRVSSPSWRNRTPADREQFTRTRRVTCRQRAVH